MYLQIEIILPFQLVCTRRVRILVDRFSGSIEIRSLLQCISTCSSLFCQCPFRLFFQDPIGSISNSFIACASGVVGLFHGIERCVQVWNVSGEWFLQLATAYHTSDTVRRTMRPNRLCWYLSIVCLSRNAWERSHHDELNFLMEEARTLFLSPSFLYIPLMLRTQEVLCSVLARAHDLKHWHRRKQREAR